MRCTGCNKDIPFLAMHPIAVRDNNGEIIRPRQTQLFCGVCVGVEKIKVPKSLTLPKIFSIF
jgi:hypothetical protein